jgi:hypothetical protein
VQSMVLMFRWQIYLGLYMKSFSLFSDYCRHVAICGINWIGTSPLFPICLSYRYLIQC